MKYLNILLQRTVLVIALAGSTLGVLSSCTDDLMPSGRDDSSDADVCVSFRCADMIEVYKGENNPASRAGGPKNPDEKAVNTLHVFFFNQADNKLLTTDEYHNFPAYQKVSNASFIKIPTGEGVSQIFKEGDTKVRIVAIANIDATDDAESAADDANSFFTDYTPWGKIQLNGRDAGGEPHKITCLEDLQKWIYYPRIRMGEGASNDISKLPAAGMPMISEIKDVDLSKKPTTADGQYIVNMRAMMAKVNVSVSLDPKQSTSEFPILKITEYGVKNMPIAVPFTPCTGNVREGKSRKKPEDFEDYKNTYDVTIAPMYHNDGSVAEDDSKCKSETHEYTTTTGLPVIINKDSDPVYFSYYTYENIQLPDYSALRTNGEDAFNDDFTVRYPQGVQDADKQRWKPTIAYDHRASALILKGEYTTDQELTYQAQFTIYMGGDEDTDFQVKRNFRYDNNIVIRGLDYIRNSEDNVFTFDGRVNVWSDNPLYLAIINERMVDAHASVLPMDVWLMLRENGDGTIIENPDWDTKIKFTVRDHEKVDWIRMEMFPRKDMEVSKNVFEPGRNVRDYFTTDLVTNTLKDNWEVTIDGEDDGSRSRIYFYIDENVPTSNNQADYGDRTATIDIEYVRTEKDEDGNDVVVDRRTRTLDIEQRALLKVSGQHQSGTVKTTWMEYYEEYLEHNDPLDQHESPGELYSGLPWGLYGVNVYTPNGFNNPDKEGIIATNRNSYYKVYTKNAAFAMTQWVINRNASASLNTIKLFNTDEPASAFHYCYGKNKRKADGTADVSGNRGWYMPGIRELELAFIDYYNVFSDFRGNFYWSASAADEGNGNPGNYARATRVSVNGTNVTYTESGSSGQLGYQSRNNVNRIRAFYRVD